MIEATENRHGARDVQDLKSRLAERLEAAVPNDCYVKEMWRFVLASGDGSPDSYINDALPYVPHEVLDTFSDMAQHPILDIGCLGGYGLYDLVRHQRRNGEDVPLLCGVDIDSESIRIADEMAEVWSGSNRPEFRVSGMEELPFEDNAFGLVIARLVLPYVQLAKGIPQLQRVVRSNGYLLVQLHSPGYYAFQVRRNMTRPSNLVYYCRPIVSELLLWLTGWLTGGVTFGETALTVNHCSRILKRCGFRPVWMKGAGLKPLVLYRLGDGVLGRP